ncbi:MAG TPA: hypothetical protein VGS12_12840 [Caulobacteraceae bacterium]|nr:hypothetical protein [Caulobacteraceae bacterium]
MARILIVVHAAEDQPCSGYLLGCFFRSWLQLGHRVSVAAGFEQLPMADVAVLHVDLSLVPGPYLAAMRRYPAAVNGRARDIRKRTVSRHRVRPGDGWAGPVIVKTDLNFGGASEWLLYQRSGGKRWFGRPPRPPRTQPYEIYPSAAAAPKRVWSAPDLIVERFLPEWDASGFHMRSWTFFGEKERCTRYRSDKPIIKLSDVTGKQSVPVPQELRAERERLGFDFGKFDFVVHEGRAVLLDANRTPAATPATPEFDRGNAELAQGIEGFLK